MLRRRRRRRGPGSRLKESFDKSSKRRVVHVTGAALYIMSLPSSINAFQSSSQDSRLLKRVVIVINTSTGISSAPAITSIANTTTNSTLTTSLPAFNATLTSITVQPTEPPKNTGSSKLRYLFLIFLVVGLIIIGIIARYVLVKRKRARDNQRREARRHQALQMDMIERGPFDDSNNEEEDGNIPSASAGALRSLGLFGSRFTQHFTRSHNEQADEEHLPPYPVHELPPYEHNNEPDSVESVQDEYVEDASNRSSLHEPKGEDDVPLRV